MASPYERYASIYDQTGQHRFGAYLARMTLARLRASGYAPETALDLATGTGAAALEIAGQGLDVTAIDSSERMLDHGRKKTPPDVRGSVDWRTGDMRTFDLDQTVDLVVCFFDSINYLLDEGDLGACFASVRASLNPGGWFVFDVNTIHRFATGWNNSTDVAHDSGDLLCLFRSTYDPTTHRSPLVLTVFERDADAGNCWRRWDEEHVERGYALNRLSALLIERGFEVMECLALNEDDMAFEGDARETSDRAVFFARATGQNGKMLP